MLKSKLFRSPRSSGLVINHVQLPSRALPPPPSLSYKKHHVKLEARHGLGLAKSSRHSLRCRHDLPAEGDGFIEVTSATSVGIDLVEVKILISQQTRATSISMFVKRLLVKAGKVLGHPLSAHYPMSV